MMTAFLFGEGPVVLDEALIGSLPFFVNDTPVLFTWEESKHLSINLSFIQFCVKVSHTSRRLVTCTCTDSNITATQA